MIQRTSSIERAIQELVATGASDYLIEQMILNASEDYVHSNSAFDDRKYRARREAINDFASAVQIVINGIADKVIISQ